MATSDSGYIETPYQDNQTNFGGGNTVNPANAPNDYNGGAPGDSYGGPTPGVNQSGVPGFLQGVGQFVTGSNNPFTNAAFVPAMATAAQQWKNADTYEQLGREAADRSDPFGKYRGYYGDRLRSLYDDPSQIENTPGYKFALNQALNATGSKLASQGFLGSTQMQNALVAQASGLAQQTFNQERNALMQMAGSQFDPANAGRMMMEGGQLAVNARNGALAAMFYPFGPGAGNGNGLGGNGGTNGLDPNLLRQTYGSNVASLGAGAIQLAKKFPGMFLSNGQLASWAQNPDGSINWDRVAQQFNQNYQSLPYTDGSIQTPMEPFNPNPNDFSSAGNVISQNVPLDPNNPYGDLTPGDLGYGDSSNINISDYVPIDDNNPYAGMDFSTGWND